ncbi:MAG: hypothetical protein JNK82_38260 [Myxococcaceae bacterium]|nr:hypothetical protein [Myxococcaceae bacterium]
MAADPYAIDVRYIDEHLEELEVKVLGRELEALGFTWLGTTEERLAGHAPAVAANWGCAARQTFASVFMSFRGQPKLFLFTPFEGGGSVLTGRYERPEVRTDDVTFSGVGRTLVTVLNETMESGGDLDAELAKYGLEWPVPAEAFDTVVDAPSLEGLLERHAREVAAKGRAPYRDWSRDARLRSIHEFYELDEAWGPLIKPAAES